MPFDPKLILPEDPPQSGDGEIELPDDLAALADQLRDDAMFLAARYPAVRGQLGDRTATDDALSLKVPASEPLPKPLPGRRTAMLSLAISSCALAVLVAISSARLFSDSVGKFERQQAAIRQPAVEPPALAAPAVLVPEATAVSLIQASSPELEALLDLGPQESSGRISISF